MDNILKGTIYVTDDLEFVRNVPDRTVKIISLDEDNTLNPNDPNVIIGTCLLPPIESMIAEVDGDEDLYDINYINHLNSPFVQEFIGALISALYKGTSLLIYAPMMKENISIIKLRQHIWTLYGITIGIVGGEPFQLDLRCIPIWMTMIYSASVISAEEFLLYYPEDANINALILDKLMGELKPFANSYGERIKLIKDYQLKLKKKPTIKQAVFDMRFNGGT